jgi:hypothetical protein
MRREVRVELGELERIAGSAIRMEADNAHQLMPPISP